MAYPHGRATGDRLVPAQNFERVMTDRGPEVITEQRVTAVTVRPGVGQDLDPVVADLDGQSVSVGVRRNGEESVRSAVAATPDLRPVGRPGPEDRDPGVAEVPRLHGWPIGQRPVPGQFRQERAGDARPCSWPPLRGAEE